MSDQDDTDFDSGWNEEPGNDGQPARAADETEPGQGDENLGGDDPAAEGPADEAPTPAAETPAGGEETPDEFADLDADQLRERLRAIDAEAKAEKAAREKAEHLLRSHSGRLSRQDRELAELRLRQPAAAPPAQEEPAGTARPTDEVLNRVASEYEDLGQPLVDHLRFLESRVEALSKSATAAAEAQKAEAQRELDSILDQQRTILDEAHPDWAEIAAKSTDYAAWAQAQPGWIQDLIRRNGEQLVDGEAAAFVFDKFKTDTKPAEDPNAGRRGRQLEGSRHVPARAPAMEPRGGGSGSFDDEWDRAIAEDKRQSARAR